MSRYVKYTESLRQMACIPYTSGIAMTAAWYPLPPTVIFFVISLEIYQKASNWI